MVRVGTEARTPAETSRFSADCPYCGRIDCGCYDGRVVAGGLVAVIAGYEGAGVDWPVYPTTGVEHSTNREIPGEAIDTGHLADWLGLPAGEIERLTAIANEGDLRRALAAMIECPDCAEFPSWCECAASEVAA